MEKSVTWEVLQTVTVKATDHNDFEMVYLCRYYKIQVYQGQRKIWVKGFKVCEEFGIYYAGKHQ